MTEKEKPAKEDHGYGVIFYDSNGVRQIQGYAKELEGKLIDIFIHYDTTMQALHDINLEPTILYAGQCRYVRADIVKLKKKIVTADDPVDPVLSLLLQWICPSEEDAKKFLPESKPETKKAR